jgi:hypothetical protein
MPDPDRRRKDLDRCVANGGVRDVVVCTSCFTNLACDDANRRRCIANDGGLHGSAHHHEMIFGWRQKCVPMGCPRASRMRSGWGFTPANQSTASRRGCCCRRTTSGVTWGRPVASGRHRWVGRPGSCLLPNGTNCPVGWCGASRSGHRRAARAVAYNGKPGGRP